MSAPADLMASTGDTPPTFFAEEAGRTLDQAFLDDLASRVELWTFPEQELVSFTTETMLPNNMPADGTVPEYPGRGSVTLVPAAPLEARWYALQLTSLPEDVAIGPFAETLAESQSAAFSSRFNPAAALVVRTVAFCQAETTVRVVLELSENINVNAALDTGLSVHAGADGEVACVRLAETQQSVSTLNYDCPASVWEAQVVRLTKSNGVLGVTGLELGLLVSDAQSSASVVDSAPFDKNLVFQDLPVIGDCKMVIPTH